MKQTKICGKCLKEKMLSDYSNNKDGLYGKKSTCKACAKLYREKYIKGNRVAYESSKEYARTHKEQAKNALFIRKYRITLADYNRMYTENNGLCCICKNYYEKLFVDHDHKNGKVRGLLCSNCNAGLGFFKDRIDIIMEAITYLERDA